MCVYGSDSDWHFVHIAGSGRSAKGSGVRRSVSVGLRLADLANLNARLHNTEILYAYPPLAIS